MAALRPWLLLAPALAVILGLFTGGLALGVAQSFGYMPIIGLTRPSLDAYAGLFALPEFWPALAMTLWIALASTTLSVVLAVAAALLLRRMAAGRTFLFVLNLPVPHVVGVLGILALFGQSGLLARIAYALGLIARPSEFPVLVNDPAGLGIILEYVWKEVPFIGIAALAALRALGEEHEAVAASLGARPWQRLRFVVLPMILPAVLPVSILVLAFTFGEYLVPLLLGQTYPATLPVLAVRLYTDPDLGQRPAAMALSVLIAVFAGLLVWAYLRAARGWVGRG